MSVIRSTRSNHCGLAPGVDYLVVNERVVRSFYPAPFLGCELPNAFS